MDTALHPGDTGHYNENAVSAVFTENSEGVSPKQRLASSLS